MPNTPVCPLIFCHAPPGPRSAGGTGDAAMAGTWLRTYEKASRYVLYNVPGGLLSFCGFLYPAARPLSHPALGGNPRFSPAPRRGLFFPS